MVLVAVCHTFDNDHVEVNCIIFAINIKVVVISRGKRAIFLFLDPSFVRFSKKHKNSFPIWVKFKVILMVFAIFCHQLDNIHVKGNFILFAMNSKVMAILWGKTSQ